MAYYIDLKKIGLDDYREMLSVADLLPSRKVLLQDIVANFDRIRSADVHNLDELLQSTKTKPKLQEFAAINNIDEQYLAVLIREIKSMQPKPNRLQDFPEMDPKVVEQLGAVGIKHTAHLYDRIVSPEGRSDLSAQTGVALEEIDRLAKLTDLSRVRWVNHTFAFVLLEAGYESSQEVAEADYHEVYESVKSLNNERQIYKGHIGLHDMKLCVEAAQLVPPEIVLS